MKSMLTRLAGISLGLLFGVGCLAADVKAQATAEAGKVGSAPYASQSVEVADGVVLAGLVDLEALAQAAPGARVVDLRTAAEGTEAAAGRARELGIDYRNVPVAGAVIDPERLDTLASIVASREVGELLVIHCASGNRAGMMWGALAVREGADVGALKASLAPVLNKPPAVQALDHFAAGGGDEPR